MIRQWTAIDDGIKTAFIALADAQASTLNSLLRPAYRPEPKPCISDEDMLRDYPAHPGIVPPAGRAE
jgi:hypothetical protein